MEKTETLNKEPKPVLRIKRHPERDDRQKMSLYLDAAEQRNWQIIGGWILIRDEGGQLVKHIPVASLNVKSVNKGCLLAAYTEDNGKLPPDILERAEKAWAARSATH